MREPLTLLYEDNHCLAVAKPAPLLMQGPERAAVPSLEALVKHYLKVRYHKARKVYLGIPHRLDRPVTGVVLFARSTTAAQRFAAQFQERTVRKVYWAVVEGEVQPAEGVWEDHMHKLPGTARSEIAATGKLARLHYRRLCFIPGGTWLEIELETGRTHQIRLQAAARGWPIWGDHLYGAQQRLDEPSVADGEATIALHARRLTFLHPIRYEPLTVTAPLPESWSWFLALANQIPLSQKS